MILVTWCVRATIGLTLLLGSVSPLRAELFVELGSVPASLDAIVIGQSVTIHVSLSGLPTNHELELLAATVLYDGGTLGTASITPGPIVPDPLNDPLDLLTNGGIGIADATFLTFGTDSEDRIRNNGVFFSFSFTAQQPGVATILLDFVDAQQFNPTAPGDPLFPLITAGLSLPVHVVPEPSTMALASVTLATWLASRIVRRR